MTWLSRVRNAISNCITCENASPKAAAVPNIAIQYGGNHRSTGNSRPNISATTVAHSASSGVKKTLDAPFKEADANGDRQVTLVEFQAARAKALDYVR